MGTGIIGMIVIGFLAGLIARAIKPGNDKLGFWMTTGLGIAGSFVAGFLGSSLGLYRQGEPVGFIASVIGAIIILVVFSMIGKKTNLINRHSLPPQAFFMRAIPLL